MFRKLVVSAEAGPSGQAAIWWCVRQLPPGTSVVAVCGLAPSTTLAYGLEPAVMVAALNESEREFYEYRCAPLGHAGLCCHCRFVHSSHVTAVRDAVAEEHPDALVVGQRRHVAVIDAFLREPARRLLRRPPCPVIVVPVERPAQSAHSIVGTQTTGRTAAGTLQSLAGHRPATCQLAYMSEDGECLTLDMLLAPRATQGADGWKPSLPATIRIELPSTPTSRADVEETLRGWLDRGTVVDMRLRNRRGAQVVQFSHSNEVMTLSVEQLTEVH